MQRKHRIFRLLEISCMIPQYIKCKHIYFFLATRRRTNLTMKKPKEKPSNAQRVTYTQSLRTIYTYTLRECSRIKMINLFVGNSFVAFLLTVNDGIGFNHLLSSSKWCAMHPTV